MTRSASRKSRRGCTRFANTARTSYGRETYRRLVSLKDAYDPANVFRLNPEHRAVTELVARGQTLDWRPGGEVGPASVT